MKKLLLQYSALPLGIEMAAGFKTAFSGLHSLLSPRCDRLRLWSTHNKQLALFLSRMSFPSIISLHTS